MNLPDLSIVANFAAFRGLSTIPSPGRPGYFVRGRQGYGDAGMGLYAWSPASTDADDDDLVIRPNDRATTSGRWVRVNVGGGSLISFADLTFTRNTIAYEEQVDGSLLEHAVNVPRIDENGMWHIEAALAEQVRHNNDPAQAQWVKTNCTVSNAAFTSPAGTLAKQITATALGDMILHQVMPARTGIQANFSVYLRSDNGPHDVNVSLNDGAINANTTVSVGNTWQRVNVRLHPQAATPTARITISSAAAGTRLAVWGATDQFSAQIRFGHVPSHFPNAGAELVRGRDILTGTVGDIPAHMLTKPWGFLWKPGWAITGDDEDGDNIHEDVTFFSFRTDNETMEVLWTAYDSAAPGAPQLGNVFVRGGPVITVVPKAVSQTLRANPTDILEIRVYPEDGLVWIGGAIEGNGFGPQGDPWTWDGFINGLGIGDRLSQPNTHTLDGWIGEPYRVPEL